MVGKVLAERYELLEKVGEGGMARVFRGRDLLLKRTVAVKVLKDQMTGDPAFIRRFEREAQSAASLSHPHIVNIYDVGEQSGSYFMVMEFMDGKSLKEYIREKGRLPSREAIAIARQIAEALREAHAAGVIHRDIKPQNILFSRDGKVKVTDFGIAIASDGTVTVGDEIIGSVQYISPEQARGGLAGKQSDLYSLGIILYEMVTGKVPFTGESPVSVAMKHIQQQIVPPRRLVNDISEGLEQVILKAVEKDSAKRYTCAEELIEDLAYAASNEGARSSNRAGFSNHSYEEDEDIILRPVGYGYKIEGSDSFTRKKRKWILPLLLVILTASALVWAGLWINNYLFTPEVAVPDIKDYSQSDGAQVLREAGLIPNTDVIYIYDDQIAVGNIVKTDPPEGRMVRKNRVVDLYISKGPEYIITPELIGRTELEAQVILDNLGLLMSPVRDYNDDFPEGQIYRQVPGESFRISPGEEVVVYVSQGRGPFQIADLVGYSEEGAVAYLVDNDLRPKITYRFTIGSSGHVIEQMPRPGEEVLPGQFVDLVIGQ